MKRYAGIALALGIVLSLLLSGSALARQETADVVVSIRSAYEDFMKEVVRNFQEANPGISVEYQVQPGKDKLITQLVAGEGPDIFETSGDTLKQMAEMGALYDLSPLVRRDFDARMIRDFFPPVWEATVLRSGPKAGMRVGLPFYINAPVFWFNRTLFDQGGLTSPDRLDKSGNWTWDTMLQASRKLTRREGDGTPIQYGMQTKYWSRNLISRPTWIWANGGDVFDYPNNPNHFVLDRPAALEALEFIQDLVWKYEVMPKTKPNNERSKFKFVNGNLAMDDDGTSEFERWADAIGGKFEYDVARRPMGKVSRGNRTSLDVYAMCSQVRNVEAAWRFMKFLVSPEMQRLQTKLLKLGPARASAVEAFVALSHRLSLDIYLDTASTAMVDPFSYIDRAEDFRLVIQPALESAMERNEKSPTVAIKEVAGAVGALYGSK